MRFVIQRVKQASVRVDETVTGSIGQGILLLAGFATEDDEALADKMLDKLLALRIFSDENGKTNLSVRDVDGELLIVSQFTLYADMRKGTRPGFSNAAPADHALALYKYLISSTRDRGMTVGEGEFGASMEVSLVNDGPFTIVMDSDEVIRR